MKCITFAVLCFSFTKRCELRFYSNFSFLILLFVYYLKKKQRNTETYTEYTGYKQVFTACNDQMLHAILKMCSICKIAAWSMVKKHPQIVWKTINNIFKYIFVYGAQMSMRVLETKLPKFRKRFNLNLFKQLQKRISKSDFKTTI